MTCKHRFIICKRKCHYGIEDINNMGDYVYEYFPHSFENTKTFQIF